MRLAALLAAAALCLLSACGGSETASDPNARRIAVIPKGTTHAFWQTVQAGANKAGSENPGHEVLWRGPVKEDETDAQIAMVESMIALPVHAIVLAPNDATALSKVVDQAAAKNIPVVIIDSDIKTDKYVSFVATDNKQGGIMAGKHMASLLNNKGKLVMLRYQEGSASTENREAGFLAGIKEVQDSGDASVNLEVVDANKYGGATADTAQAAAERLLAAYSNPDGTLKIDGIFTPNESTTEGMLKALRTLRARNPKLNVRFIGFDASDNLQQALRQGEIDALIIQNPHEMGYQGVKTAIDALQGKKDIPKRIDTGVGLLTQKNIDTPEMMRMLNKTRQ